MIKKKKTKLVKLPKWECDYMSILYCKRTKELYMIIYFIIIFLK